MSQKVTAASVAGEQTGATVSALESAEAARVRPTRTLWGNAWRQFRHHELAMLGLVLFITFIVITFLGPLVYKEDYFSPFKYETSLGPGQSA